MSERDLPRINYCHAQLEELLGGHIDPILASNDTLRTAARAITDSVGSSQRSAQDKLANAAHWVSEARREGVLAGRLEERQAWEQKIKRLFEVGS